MLVYNDSQHVLIRASNKCDPVISNIKLIFNIKNGLKCQYITMLSNVVDRYQKQNWTFVIWTQNQVKIIYGETVP